MVEKNRIEYIDLAKGICILMVVLAHLNTYFPKIEFASIDCLTIFRMPLYFMLSGLFFKSYNGFVVFIKRKTNKLLIPFLFFFLVTSVFIPNLLYVFGYEVRNADSLGIQSLWSFIYPIHHQFPNGPLWFLLCLFFQNILFYLVFLVAKLINKDKTVYVILVLCMFIGFLGYNLGTKKIAIPMYIDTAMTTLPFFCVGYILRKYTNILHPNYFDKYIIPVSIVCIFVTYLFAGYAFYNYNEYKIGVANVYICGIAGSISVLLISKLIKHLPLISYFGKYSIMILCTHNLVLQTLVKIISRLNFDDIVTMAIIFIITVLMYVGIIPIMLKYLPYVTAQKDLIKTQ